MLEVIRAPVSPPLNAENEKNRRQRRSVAVLMASVIALDQAVKWWAWRYIPGAEINSGGDIFTGATIGRWYADPVTGALLDLLDSGLLAVAVWLLVRRRRPAAVVLLGAMAIAGWSSNLLDRLGMHYWTAPGSYRGVIDFIPIYGGHYNVADLFIIGATPLFMLVLGWQAAKRLASIKASAPVMVKAVPATKRRPHARTWMAALAGTVLVMLAVSVGAANYGEAETASTHIGATADQRGAPPVQGGNRGQPPGS